jgi:ABC-type sugar transport system, permease component
MMANNGMLNLQYPKDLQEFKRKNGRKYAAILTSFIILALFSIFTLAPFYFMLVSSFKPGAEMFRYGINVNLQPEIMSLKNYMSLFTGKEGIYLLWFKNSIMLTLIQTSVSIILGAMVGYGLAVYQFRGRSLIFITVLVVMMVPIEILILPLYKLITALGIIDTYTGAILPYAVPPVAIFFFRQYAVGLPKDIIDSGRIDGCSEFGIFVKLMSPIMKPAFGAMIILQAMGSWNGFVWPIIALRSNEKLTLPIGLASLMTPYGNNYDMLMSGAVISVIPIVIVFLFNQRSFISGLTVGAIKG